MGRRTRGEKSKGPVKKGNWGNGYIIEKMKTSKRLNCGVCKYYCDEGTCKKSNVYVSQLGYNFWKNCKHFFLSDEFSSEENINYVRRIRGDDCYTKSKEEKSKEFKIIEDDEKKYVDLNNLKIINNAFTNQEIELMDEVNDFTVDFIGNICALCLRDNVDPSYAFIKANHLTNKFVKYNKLNTQVDFVPSMFIDLAFIKFLIKELNYDFAEVCSLTLEEKRKIAYDYMNQETIEVNDYLGYEAYSPFTNEGRIYKMNEEYNRLISEFEYESDIIYYMEEKGLSWEDFEDYSSFYYKHYENIDGSKHYVCLEFVIDEAKYQEEFDDISTLWERCYRSIEIYGETRGKWADVYYEE